MTIYGSGERAASEEGEKGEHTTLYASVSREFKRLVAPQPLPRMTTVFLSGLWGS